ncbi:MAG: 30S ribosomal protein S8e, partial [Candidatus Hadarchaeota archaeon]|nr:30S ribosomal protein S8e [Candidatus Hadarchaeota archaeon]
MVRWQGKSRFKPSGGRVWPKRKKRKHEMGRESAETKVGASKKVKEVVVRGGNRKLKLL